MKAKTAWQVQTFKTTKLFELMQDNAQVLIEDNKLHMSIVTSSSKNSFNINPAFESGV